MLDMGKDREAAAGAEFGQKMCVVSVFLQVDAAGLSREQQRCEQGLERLEVKDVGPLAEVEWRRVDEQDGILGKGLVHCLYLGKIHLARQSPGLAARQSA